MEKFSRLFSIFKLYLQLHPPPVDTQIVTYFVYMNIQRLPNFKWKSIYN